MYAAVPLDTTLRVQPSPAAVSGHAERCPVGQNFNNRQKREKRKKEKRIKRKESSVKPCQTLT